MYLKIHDFIDFTLLCLLFLFPTNGMADQISNYADTPKSVEITGLMIPKSQILTKPITVKLLLKTNKLDGEPARVHIYEENVLAKIVEISISPQVEIDYLPRTPGTRNITVELEIPSDWQKGSTKASGKILIYPIGFGITKGPFTYESKPITKDILYAQKFENFEDIRLLGLELQLICSSGKETLGTLDAGIFNGKEKPETKILALKADTAVAGSNFAWSGANISGFLPKGKYWLVVSLPAEENSQFRWRYASEPAYEGSNDTFRMDTKISKNWEPENIDFLFRIYGEVQYQRP